jgi:D-lactate dehydrogenase
LITPRAALVARDADDVRAAMLQAGAAGVPVTFRSGGTSLSGQASGDGVLVDVRQGFTKVTPHHAAHTVTVEGGATLRLVNQVLAPHGRVLGPDPASEIACTMGGVVANNSSGMACGTRFNTYQTLESLVAVLASGTVVDTAAPDADQRLAALEPVLYRELRRLRDQVTGSPSALAVIRHQYSMKNTMGYGVNSFVDFARPIDILAHLMVGSEGTLGFIASATLRTLPILEAQATALLVFPDLAAAADAVAPLAAAGATTIELEDAASIRAAQAAAPEGDPIRQVTEAGATALLVDARTETAGELEAAVADLDRVLPTLNLARPGAFSTDPARRAALWQSRKGLYTAVAGARTPGSTALLEDIAVPGSALPGVCESLQQMFRDYRYADGVIFGHAKDGNVHFMISLRLDRPADLRAYESFTDEMVDLVLGAGGTLNAEHGTGRIMAPFVRRQFGDELYQVMKDVKAAFDPDGRLSPGVVLSDDPRSHLRHLKPAPLVSAAVDQCVECGYCEPGCPARNLTTTPRQRVALMRTMAAAAPRERARLIREFEYFGVDTCAADSLCQIACPVGIDTGKVMKTWRAARLGPLAQRLGVGAARHWGALITVLRAALRVAAALPPGLLTGVTKAARTVLPQDWIPEAGPDLPGPGTPRRQGFLGRSSGETGSNNKHLSPFSRGPSNPGGSVSGVYFPACVNSLFGAAEPGTPGVGGAFASLCERAGVTMAAPAGIGGLCCGTVWESKGLTAGLREMAARVACAAWEATDGGRLPLVADAASCSWGLTGLGDGLDGEWAERWARVRVLDAVAFARETLVPRLTVAQPLDAVAVHPTCSTAHLGTEGDLAALAGLCARDVFIPDQWGCCAFAGDRGMLHPELTRAATAPEAAAVRREEARRARGGAGREGRFDAYVSCNRTCEMGISRATGRPYRHVLEVLADVTA